MSNSMNNQKYSNPQGASSQASFGSMAGSSPSKATSQFARLGNTGNQRVISQFKQQIIDDEMDSASESQESSRLGSSRLLEAQKQNQTESQPIEIRQAAEQPPVQFSEMNEMQQLRFMLQKRGATRPEAKYGGQGQRRQFQRTGRQSKFYNPTQRVVLDPSASKGSHVQISQSSINRNQQIHGKIDHQYNPKTPFIQQPRVIKKLFTDFDEAEGQIQQQNHQLNSQLTDQNIGNHDSNKGSQPDSQSNNQQLSQNRKNFNRKISQFGIKNINDDKLREVNKMDVDSSDYYSASQSEEIIGSNRKPSFIEQTQMPSFMGKFKQQSQASSNNSNAILKQSQVVHDSLQVAPNSGGPSSIVTSQDENKNTLGQLTDSLVSVGRESSSQNPRNINIGFDPNVQGLAQSMDRRRLRNIEHLQMSHYAKIESNRSNELTGSGSEGFVADIYINNFTNTIQAYQQRSMNQLIPEHMMEKRFEQVPQPSYNMQTPPLLTGSTSSNQTDIANFSVFNNKGFHSERSEQHLGANQDPKNQIMILNQQNQDAVLQNINKAHISVSSSLVGSDNQPRSFYNQPPSQTNSPQKGKSQFSKYIGRGGYDQEDEMSDEVSSSNYDELSDRQGALRRVGSKQGINNQIAEEEQRYYQNNDMFKLSDDSKVKHALMRSNQSSPDEQMHPEESNQVPPKQFDRYVGNIAESDEDYNEEEESNSDQHAPSNHDRVKNIASSDQIGQGILENINEQRKASLSSQVKKSDTDNSVVAHLNGILIQDQNIVQVSQNIESLPQPIVNNLMTSEEILQNDSSHIKIMNELSQKLDPQLGPLKKENQQNRRSQFSQFSFQNLDDLQQAKDEISHNDAGSSISSEKSSKNDNGLEINDKYEEDDEEEYNLPEELDDVGKDSIPQTLATTINNQNINNFMSPSRLIDSTRESKPKQMASRNIMGSYKMSQEIETSQQNQNQLTPSNKNRNSITSIFRHARKSSQDEVQYNNQLASQRVSNPNQISRTPQIQSNMKYNLPPRKNSVSNQPDTGQPSGLKQSIESNKFILKFPLLSSSREQAKSQKSQTSNRQVDETSNQNQSRKDSISNREIRTDNQTHIATQGGSVSQSNNANACGVSLSSMNEQLKNELNISNSPKAITSNSQMSQEKMYQQRLNTKRAFQSSANAKTLNEKLQILHSQSQGMNLQTNLANISTLNFATKGSNSQNSEAKSISAISISLNAREEAVSERIESRGTPGVDQRRQQTQVPITKPGMQFTKKLNQKVIDDNFNYHTEQTDMQTIYTLPQEEDFKNLQQYIDKQKSRKINQNISILKQEQNKEDVEMKVSKTDSIPIDQNLLSDGTVPFFPDIVNNNKNYNEDFIKQFQDIISAKLKKKLKNPENIKEIQENLAPKQNMELTVAVGEEEYLKTIKRTLILTIDDCLLKTSIFKEELPQVDAEFSFKKLKVYVCFRSYLSEFLHNLKKYYEVIAWTSSQLEYSNQLVHVIEDKLNFKFDLSLSVQDQVPSEDNLFYVKNIEILCGQSRLERNIIMVDSQMSNFTNKLTNGIYFPPLRLTSGKDECLISLLKYLTSFVLDQPDKDVRNRIKVDFDLLNRFNNNKQCLAFQKILVRTVKESSESALANIGVSAQKEMISQLRDSKNE